MNKKFYVIFFLLLIAMIFLNSCSTSTEENLNYSKRIVNGVNIITSDNRPANPNYKYEIKKAFEIKSIENNHQDSLRYISAINDIEIDDKGYIYILDPNSCSVKIFDNKGKYIKSFGNKGMGPGEMISASSILLADEYILIINSAERNLVKFDISGNFVEKINIENRFPSKVYKISEDKYYGIGNMVSMLIEDGETKMKLERFLSLINSNFKKVKDIINEETNCKLSDSEKIMSSNKVISTSMNSKIYVAINSDSEYKIDIYGNINGEKESEIRKKYAKVSKKYGTERDKKRNKPKSETKNNTTTFEMNLEKGTGFTKSKFQNSISNIYSDHLGRLLVQSPSKDINEKNGYLYFDLFENNIFINRIKLNISDKNRIFFRSDKIISLDEETNKLTIYDIL